LTAALKDRVTSLYPGGGRSSVRFRYAMVAFDFLSIAYFVLTAPFPDTALTSGINAAIGVCIVLDLAARFWVSTDKLALLRRVYVIADIVVVASLLLDSVLQVDLTFLRILRGLRLVDSLDLLRDLRRESAFFRRREDVIVATINLFVFILFCASLVFALYADSAPGFPGYVDALYFTVTTLTTTGYGDIVPQSTGGKLVAVMIMIGGVTLFVRLARALMSPSKVRYRCRTCGLSRHDPDAVHCKHCGETVRIETTGSV
jgi:voltage-gated potassium channel